MLQKKNMVDISIAIDQVTLTVRENIRFLVLKQLVQISNSQDEHESMHAKRICFRIHTRRRDCAYALKMCKCEFDKNKKLSDHLCDECTQKYQSEI